MTELLSGDGDKWNGVVEKQAVWGGGVRWVGLSAYLLVALRIYLVSLAGIRQVHQGIVSPQVHRSAYTLLSECAVSPRERSKLLLSGP